MFFFFHKSVVSIFFCIFAKHVLLYLNRTKKYLK